MDKRDTTGRPQKLATAHDSPIPARLLTELTAAVVAATKESQRLRGKKHGTGQSSGGRPKDPEQLRGELDRIRAEIERERHRHESGIGVDRTQPPPNFGGRRNADKVAMGVKDFEDAMEAMRQEQERAKKALEAAKEEQKKALAILLAYLESLNEAAAAITST